MDNGVEQHSTPFMYLNKCRVCLENSEKFYPLVGHVANVETTVANMITYCTSLEVELSDDLPNGVCVLCFRIIRIAYNFVIQYNETLKILTNNRLKLEKIDTDINKDNDSSLETEIVEDIYKSTDNQVNVYQNERNNDSSIILNSKNLEVEVIEEELEEQDIDEHTSIDEANVDMVNCTNESNVKLEKSQIIEPVSDESNIQYLFDISDEQNSRQEESVEHILIVTENQQEKPGNLGQVHIQDKTPKYTLRRKIVSRLTCPKCPTRLFTGCDKGFKSHIIQKHSKETFSCNLCSQKNLRIKEYLQHFEEIHRYQCPVCLKSFPKNSARVTHMREHSNVMYQQSLKPPEMDDNQLNILDLDLTEQQNCVDEISEDTTHKQSYVYRRRLVTRYLCPKCPNAKPYLNYEKGFLSHVLLQHSHEMFSCNLCSKENLNIDEFLRHFEQIHRHQCPICNKSFNRVSTKQVHMKMHSNIRYDCTYCDKSFYAPWFLKKHMNTHTETVKYTCDDCGYSSATYDNFRYHMKKHQGPKHLCMYCGQSFLLAVHLKYHMWKHTGDKYFKCDQCSKSYTSGSRLKKHKRRHH